MTYRTVIRMAPSGEKRLGAMSLVTDDSGDEPVDSVAVAVDDALLDAVGSGLLSVEVAMSMGDPMAVRLVAWRATVLERLS